MLYDAVVKALPAMALWFIVAGGVLYSSWRDLPRLAAAAFPERDLAWLCAVGRGLPLYGGARYRLGAEKITDKRESAMQVTGKVVVVTGGGNGIGSALCEAFHRAGAARVVVADIDPDAARAVARRSTARPSNAMSARKRTSFTSSRRPSTSSARSRCSAPMPASAAASIRCRSMPAAIPTSRGSAAGPFTSWRMSMRRGI